jgi:hypothetical protein
LTVIKPFIILQQVLLELFHLARKVAQYSKAAVLQPEYGTTISPTRRDNKNYSLTMENRMFVIAENIF